MRIKPIQPGSVVRQRGRVVGTVIAGERIPAGALVYVTEMRDSSVFPDIDQMLQDLQPHCPRLQAWASNVQLSDWREQLVRDIQKVMGIPKHLTRHYA